MTVTESSRVGVLGAGSWGTSLAVHVARCGHPTTLWCRTPERRRALESGSNERYLPGIAFPETLAVTDSLDDLAEHELILLVVPSHGFRSVLREFLSVSRVASPTVVSGTKGIEQDSLARMSNVCFEEGARVEREIPFAVLSGPSFATELAAGDPTACVVASEDAQLARSLQDGFSQQNLRLYTSSDVVGVELGGTAKNIVAIAAGLADGLGFGHNTLAALMTRGLHEVTRLGLAYGGRPRTFSGLAGMGDLVLTCTGPLSRNRQTGVGLAQGKSLDQISEELSMVAEGVKNSVALSRLAAARKVEMPITQNMVEVLYEGKSPRAAVEELMRRDLKSESEL